jgi:repressor LexA
MLTRKQQELLLFIHRHLTQGGVSPSFDEMKQALNLKSKSGIHRLITGLEERGFIRRLPHRARALEVLKLPDGLDRPGRADSQPFRPRLVASDEAPEMPVAEPAAASLPTPLPPGAGGDGAVDLPLYGRIAAGTPIEALRDPDTTASVPADLIAGGEHYALTVEGDSMIDAGILDGDTVIIRRCDTAENGTIVVALVDGQEATLKRLRRRGNTIALEPANGAYETRIFGPDRVAIQGRLVGLIRHY